MKVLLCILDGLGVAEKTDEKLSIPFIQNNLHKCVLLNASGEHVGLTKGQMGNSEVGHMAIGSGRVIKQYFTKINDSIANNNFPDIQIPNSDTYHLIALLSDGGVHSHIGHIVYLIKRLKSSTKKLYLHIITDGRDTSPRSVEKYIYQIMPYLDETCKIATIGGRYYVMDRDNRLERTEIAYNAIALGKAAHKFNSVFDVISKNYEDNITDEFFLPFCDVDYKGFDENDTVVFCNFRSDRMKQIVKMIYDKSKVKKMLSMVDYFDGQINDICSIFSKEVIKNTLGEIISENEKKQLRIAETEKYAHVTFFFNCGNEIPYENEDRILMPSPKVATYDLQPEMSAYAITDELNKTMLSKKYHFICVNFANADMVGHTGNIAAAEESCKVLDICLHKIQSVALNNEYIMLVTADHGNVEQMFDEKTNQPHTAHTLNKVPFICINDEIERVTTSNQHGLRDVAPTILSLMGLTVPNDMTGTSLFKITND